MSELLNLLIAESGMDIDDLKRVIRTAPKRYKVFQIEKRSGGKREIAQPARELKRLQRILMEYVLAPLPVHPAATAYRKGLSILDNAKPHGGSGPILKLDFSDFFPSIRAEDWLLYCAENQLLSVEDRKISAQLLFRQAKFERLLKLSIGAPSSPMLSNILMARFDEAIATEADRRKIVYTRYADDLTFSGQRAGMLKDMVKEVERAVRRMDRPKLRINAEKTTFITAATKRSVTGIVLANDGSVGIGRDRKRLLSSRVHHAIVDKLAREDLQKLAGELAYVNVVEPEFIAWLHKKYGRENIEQIKRLRQIG
jgi:RNA-directed DNA polymerase